MRKKFTMLLASLFLMMGTAKADFTLSYSQDTNFWGSVITEYPSGVSQVITDASIANAEVHCLSEKVSVNADGTVTVTFLHVGGQGSHCQHIVGVVLKNADVEIADYHHGKAGGTPDQNTYTLSNVTAGDYTLSFYVTRNGNDLVNKFGGTITVTGADRTILGSTAENKIFYNIKNVRSGNYANYEGAGVQFTQVTTPGFGSYWYLMEVADAQNVPEGYKAYRLYNAGNALAVENPGSGNMTAPDAETTPAKVYCIGGHTKDGVTGVVIRTLGEDGASWNDYGGTGTKIANHSYDDAGSIWAFEKVNITESQLIQNAVAAKTAVLNTLTTEATNTQRYFYSYKLSDIEAKKAEIEAISVPDNSLVEAVTGAIAISKNTLLAGCERVAPKAGDKFTMDNNERNGRLTAFAAGEYVRCQPKSSPFAYFDALWTLVATETEGQFNLYNEKLKVYVGVLENSNNTTFNYVSSATEAGVYELANVDGYATFKKVGGDQNSHLHMSNWGSGAANPYAIVRWDNGGPSQWRLVKDFGPQLTTDVNNPICYALRSGRDMSNGKYYYYTLDGDKVKLYNNKNIATDETTHWYFMLDDNGHLKMYSKSDTDNTAMGYRTGTDGANKLTNDATAEDYDSDTYTLYFAPYNKDDKNGAWFALKPSRGNTFVSNHGGTGNYMGFYNEYNDHGTRIAFEGVDRLKLAAKIAECEVKVVGDAIGYYSVSGGDAATALDAAKAALEGSDIAAYRTSLTALEALTYTLNLPEVGKFYRFSYNFGDAGVKYVQARASNVANKTNAMVMTDEQDKASIFYYDEGATSGDNDNKLRSYSTGQYVDESDRGLQPEGSQGGNTSFEKGSSAGLLKIKVSNYFHANVANGVYFVDHCGSDNGDNQHNFTVEKVDMTPVINELNALATEATTVAAFGHLTEEEKTALTTAATTMSTAATTLTNGGFVKDMTTEMASASALIDAAKYITNLEDLSNNVSYTVSADTRGAWYSEDAQLNSTGKLGVTYSTKDANQQFAFLKSANSGKYYLYSVGKGKFVKATEKNAQGNAYTALTENPEEYVAFLNGTNTTDAFLWVVALNGSKHMGISNGFDPAVITHYNATGDQGNKSRLEVAAAFNPTEALAKIEAYELAAIKAELTAKIAEAKELAGKNFIGDDTKQALNDAATAAEGVRDNAEATYATIAAQIPVLSEAILAAGYVTSIDGFSNNAVYTFLSNRSTTAYLMYDGTNDFVASQFKQTSLEVGADKANCQWAVYKSTENNYYMYNLGAQKFMGIETGENVGIPFSETPQTTTLKFEQSAVNTHPIMISSNGGSGAVNHSSDNRFTNNYGVVNWDGGFGFTGDPGNVHKVAIVGALEENVLTTIANAVTAFEKQEALNQLQQALAEATNLVALWDMGYYTATVSEPNVSVDAIRTWKTNNKDTATATEIKEKIAELNTIIASFVFVEPASGFYRISYNFGTEDESNVMYMQAKASNVTDKTNALVMTDDQAAASIFYYVGGKLLSYSEGLYVNEAGNNRGLNATGADVNIGDAGQFGKYKIQVGNYLHASETDGVYFVDHCSSDPAEHTAHKFSLEKVTELPVTIKATEEDGTGYATYYTPVAVTVPTGVTASVVTGTENGKVVLSDVTGIIPAGTGLILNATANTYYFAIATEAAAEDFEQGDLKGSTAKTLITAEEGTNYYVLAKPDGATGAGLYKASLNKDASGNKVENGVAFHNGANKAYLPYNPNDVEEEGDAPQEAPAMFSFGNRGEGTTAIENSEFIIQNSEFIYDLTGRRIEKIAEKGIYIVNGKKVVIK